MRPHSASANSKGRISKKNARPQSAADSNGHLSSVAMRRASISRVSLRELASKETTKRPSSSQLIQQLEGQVRKVVDEKRAECDKLQFTLIKKRADLEKAKLVLEDLKKEANALGLNEYPREEDRLCPVTSISRRPVYTKHTVRYFRLLGCLGHI